MSQTNPAAPEPTEIAGRYLVVQKLGAGAFGTVYKAKDKTLGRMVAIKTIRLEGLAASHATLDDLQKRFLQEARAGAALKHPNIATVYDVGEAGGMSYLAMEFIDGVGLERIIAEGRMPVGRATGLAAQVADALGYAHQQGVIHRDIKPANVMVEAGERVKVTDFGIAKIAGAAEQLTQTGSLLGTPSYMSPEQARGEKVDGRSDLFSVGCVLYELLAGKQGVPGRLDHRPPLQDHPGGARASALHRSPDPGRGDPDRPEGHFEERRDTLPDGARALRRSPCTGAAGPRPDPPPGGHTHGTRGPPGCADGRQSPHGRGVDVFVSDGAASRSARRRSHGAGASHTDRTHSAPTSDPRTAAPTTHPRTGSPPAGARGTRTRPRDRGRDRGSGRDRGGNLDRGWTWGPLTRHPDRALAAGGAGGAAR